MSDIRRGLLLTLLMAFCPSTVMAQATVSLRAIARNGFSFPATSSIAVFPNDVVTVEIYIAGWGNPPFDGSSGLLHEYQLTLAGKASVLSSGYCPGPTGSRVVLPYGWDAPIEKEECPCASEEYPVCHPAFGCVGLNHHPEWMAAIESAQFGRIDSVFHPQPYVCSLDTSSLDIGWSCMLAIPGGQSASKCVGGLNYGSVCSSSAQCQGGTCSPTFQHYAGTLYLKAGAQACGTFTYTLQADSLQTFLSNGQAFPVMALPVIQPLTLFVPQVCSNPVGACCTTEELSAVCTLECAEDCAAPNQRFGGVGSNCATLNPPCEQPNFPEGSTPTNCTVDARIPFLAGQPSQRRGFSQITLSFVGPIRPDEDSADDFQITQMPATTPPFAPTITNVILESANSVTLQFSEPVQPNKWTCIRHLTSNVQKCLGFLPGDTNSDLIVVPADILDIIDNLNGVRIPTLATHQCDIDRSGVCAPADVLTEIDLLNGANGFPVQNGDTLPVCPSITP